jgi:NAD(P)-dependent dehydrogenase (short-subunit alcohol dehydrogenase family)
MASTQQNLAGPPVVVTGGTPGTGRGIHVDRGAARAVVYVTGRATARWQLGEGYWFTELDGTGTDCVQHAVAAPGWSA